MGTEPLPDPGNYCPPVGTGSGDVRGATEKFSGARSTSCSTTASSMRSSGGSRTCSPVTNTGKSQFDNDDRGDWFDDAKPAWRQSSPFGIAPPQPIAPARHQSAPAAPADEPQQAVMAAQAAEETLEVKTINQIKNVSLTAESSAKPKTSAMMPVGDDFFASVGVN